MSEAPNLIDRPALMKKRARAALNNPAMFLHDIAMGEVLERLEEVNRTFTKVAVVTAFPEHWQKSFPTADMFDDNDTLEMKVGRYDLVIHGLCLHAANDPVGQLVQSRRALEPDGLFLAATFGGQTLSELRAALSEAEVLVTGGISPRVIPMGELRDLGGLLQRAGFAQPVADAVPNFVTYSDMNRLMHDLREMGETNVLTQRKKGFTGAAVLAHAARIYDENFRTDDERIKATFEIIFLTGWAPSDTQQKPLRPGSAVTRLADALGTTEFDESATSANIDADQS